jgi:gliding motility-associated-like protein
VYWRFFILSFIFSINLSSAWGQVIDTLYPSERIQYYYVEYNSGYEYFWEVDGGYIIVYQNNGSAIYVEWDTLKNYHRLSVYEKDKNGCYSDTTEGYVLFTKPNKLLVEGDTAICDGETISLLASGSDGYLWSTGQKGPEIKIQPYRDTIIYVQGYNLKDTATKFHYIKVFPTPNAEFSYTPESPYTFDSILFYHKGGQNLTYQWTLGNNKLISDSNSFFWYFENDGNKYFKLKIENEFGCSDTHSQRIYISSKSYVFLPNVFSPNGDGLNDSFSIVGQGIAELEVLIYNRFGELVFHSYDVNFAWDGKFNDVDCPIDAYYYQLYGRDRYRKLFSKKGTVTIVR